MIRFVFFSALFSFILAGNLSYSEGSFDKSDHIDSLEGIIIKKIVVWKSLRKMELIDEHGDIWKTYDIWLGRNPVGHKQQEGDNRTPEGDYKISGHNPNSKYHLSLKIDYPKREDRRSAKKRGVNPGSNIMIHGLPNPTTDNYLISMAAAAMGINWTRGCIAVNNFEIEEIYALVKKNTPITINP